MHPRAGWALRCTRALVLAGVALVLAVFAHLSAGGLLPGPWTFVLMLAAGAAVNMWWFGREVSARELIGLLVAGQTLMHAVMTAVAGHADDPEPEQAAAGPVAHVVEHLVSDMTADHLPMALAHLAAAVATGLWLAQGERAVWSLLRLLADVTRAAIAGLFGAPARPALFVLPARAGCVVAPARLRHRLMSVTHLRRGPPAVRCAV